MRPSVIAAILFAVAFAGGSRDAAAQSAYDYPYCALYGDKSGAQSCYYTSYRQCMATLSGIGGTCIESPYYRGPRPQTREQQRRRSY